MNYHIKAVEANSDDVPLTFSVPVRRVLEIVWARRRAIALIALGISTVLVLAKLYIAPSYNATATVQVGLLDRDLLEQEQVGDPNVTRLRTPVITDLANLESQETRFLGSEALARAVVARLGLDTAQSESKLAQILEVIGKVFPVQYTAPRRADLATQKFMGSLDVSNEPRSNLIRVTTTADSPAEAADMANAVVAEYVHHRQAQALALRRARASALIAELAVVYGMNHPSILRAKELLANAKAAQEAHRAGQPPTATELALTGYVIPAGPDSTPAGMTLKGMILLAIAAGLVCGVACVLLHAFFRGGEAGAPRPEKWPSREP